MEVWEYNRGEWTEAYVFLKLLGVGRMYGATISLSKDSSIYIDVVDILRFDNGSEFVFNRFTDEDGEKVKELLNNTVVKIVVASELEEKAFELFNEIKGYSSNKGKLKALSTQHYLEGLYLSGPKPSYPTSVLKQYGQKTDIVLRYKDSMDRSISINGFSIKSHLGSSSTLYNSSQTSSLLFRVVGCDAEKMYQINSKGDFLAMIEYIKESGMTLEYLRCMSDVFLQNICLVDSQMPLILRDALLFQIGYYDSDGISSSVKDIANAVCKSNPLNVQNPDYFYPAKFKDFLFNSFAGMTASKPWNGQRTLSGGFVDVDKKGEILFYRAISDNVFQQYLFEHTYFDRPDRGYIKDLAVAKAKAHIDGKSISPIEEHNIIYDDKGKIRPKKGDWGYVFRMGEDYVIGVNFQIRFR